MEVMKEVKMRRYEAYRESETDWIGDIPENWGEVPNKHIFHLKKSQVGKRSDQYDLLSLTLQGIIKRNLEDGGKFPAEFDTYQEVSKGDFVFCLFDVEETPRTVGLSNFDGMITGAYTVMKLNSGFEPGYVYYFYLNLDSKKRLRPLYKGLRNTIPKESFFSLKSFVPPLPEQTAIAAFLDEKTAKIGQAIAQKERLIELLKERKQILIQELVTGKKVWDEATQSWVKPTETVDSGVDWIGEIPKGWEVKRFKHFTKILSGYSPEQVMFSENAELDYFKVDNLNDVDENYFLANSSWKIEQKWNVRVAPEGTLLIPKRGGAIGTNKIAICTTECTFDTNVMGLLFDNRIVLTELIAVWVKLRNLITIADTTTIPQINNKHINPLEIALPDMKEQGSILSYIKDKSNQIEVSINLQRTQIEKLKEYKAVLIDSAVTGKIKVC